jgi:UDP-N-acetylmuramoyl-L-alanyl-D-glutamate--2,6-diaminopimelate ligase
MAKEMVEANAKFMMIEASSHALSQHRLDGINFAAGAFTNLTGDHRDYHKTTENYLAAKTRLFEELGEGAIAILNKRSEFSKAIGQKTTAKILWYAVNETADITGWIESMDVNSCIFRLEHGGDCEKVRTPLIGEHNVSNHLAAAGLCIAAGFDLKTISKGLSNLKAVPGRLEPIDCGQDFTVLVDYAHTDDALKNASKTLRPICKGKLIVLFGCGGDRDKTKRPRMAKVAEELAGRVIVTSDNPRTEDPQQIVRDIAAGFVDPESEKISIEPDRKKAIESAIKAAQKDDIVLIAGKGHETYQVIGTEKIDFDDRLIAREILGKI